MNEIAKFARKLFLVCILNEALQLNIYKNNTNKQKQEKKYFFYLYTKV